MYIYTSITLLLFEFLHFIFVFSRCHFSKQNGTEYKIEMRSFFRVFFQLQIPLSIKKIQSKHELQQG